MDKIELSIPDYFIHDFTISYRGTDGLNEIQTSKEVFLSKLRLFKDQKKELQYQDEIFIRENYPFKLFSSFISSLETKKIEIEKDNYITLYELSNKYQYLELKQQVDQFIKQRPDLNSIIEQLSETQKESNALNEDDFDLDQELSFSTKKEEIISENLDFCLQNSLLNKLPIQIIARILTSPKKKVTNQHLLFNFIKEKIKEMKNESENKTKERKEIEEHYIEILKSSLDLNELNLEELDELFNNEIYSTQFNSNNIINFIKLMTSEKNKNDEKMAKFEDCIQKELKEKDKKILQIDQKIINESSERKNLEKSFSKKSEEINGNILNINNLFNEEIIKIKNKLTDIMEKLNKEINNRQSEFTNIQKQINELTNLQDDVSNINQQLKEETTNRQNDVSNITKQIKNETINRQNEISNIQAKLEEKVNIMQSNITQINQQLTEETTNRQNDVSNITKQIKNETINKQNEISNIQAKFEEKINNMQSNITQINQQLTKETTKRQNEILDIKHNIELYYSIF